VFLAGAAAAAAAATLPGCASPARPGTPGHAIDTHTHFYDPARPQGVAWPAKDDPVLYRTVLPPECEALARPLGIAGTVVVEASPLEEDNQWILDLAVRERFIVGLVGHLKPGRPGFREKLERYGRNPLFRGIRSGGWDVDVEPGRSDYRADLALLADRGLSLDVLVGPERLGDVAKLADALPALTMVINHVANVRIDGGPPPTAWREGMKACAARRNVVCKVSGLVEGTGRNKADAPRDTAFYKPVLDTVWEHFGEERVVFGSDWPVSARFASYATVHGIVRDYVADRGPRALERFFGGNAQRVYRFAS
jgi:predicted TIM-barrel fold metal-dependent hydrolase